MRATKRRLGDDGAAPATPTRSRRSSSTGAPLVRLGRKARVSQSGIEQLLLEVGKQGLPHAVSRRTQTRERKRLCSELTPFGALIQEVHVGEVVLPILHPAALLWHCSALTAFKEILARAMLEGPSTLMVYSDGITPQDGLSKHDRRKLVAVYWSVLQIDEFLFSEDAWFPIAVMRNTLLELIDGGLTRVIRDLLLGAFFCATADWRRGIALQGVGSMVVDSVCLLADMPAVADS
jgi:hypothetical protein